MGKSNYAGFQSSQAPTFLARPYGQAWLYALGSIKDWFQQRLQMGVKARFASLAPPDALAALGLERGIIRGGSETNAAYAGRVQAAWTSWQWAGTAFGVLSQLWAIGYKSTVILSRGLPYSLDANGNLITPVQQAKGLNPFWSTFCVIVPHPWPTSWLGSANWTTKNLGPGTGNLINFSGVPSPDYSFVVKIGTSGVAGGAATYLVSTDGGVTFPGSAIALATSGNNLSVTGAGGAGVPTFGATSNPFFSGQIIIPAQIPPADGGVDSNIFRAVISQWKPASALCSSISVLGGGWLYGYPLMNWGAASHLPWGGQIVTSWAPPTT